MKRPNQREPRPTKAADAKPAPPKYDADGYAALGYQVAMLAKARDSK